MQHHKIPFAHDHEQITSFLDAVRSIRPTAIIGVSAQPGAFDTTILREMARLHERPLIFSLSNPTSLSECTAEEAIVETNGKGLFASGSPFPPVEFGGKTFITGQVEKEISH